MSFVNQRSAESLN